MQGLFTIISMTSCAYRSLSPLWFPSLVRVGCVPTTAHQKCLKYSFRYLCGRSCSSWCFLQAHSGPDGLLATQSIFSGTVLGRSLRPFFGRINSNKLQNQAVNRSGEVARCEMDNLSSVAFAEILAASTA